MYGISWGVGAGIWEGRIGKDVPRGGPHPVEHVLQIQIHPPAGRLATNGTSYKVVKSGILRLRFIEKIRFLVQSQKHKWKY